MKKVFLSLLVIATMFIGMSDVLAGRGCCSHHGGQSYCSNGRWVCRDETYSPTCTCNGDNSSSGYITTTRRTTTTRQIYGCMDSTAINFNSYANISDGGCRYEKTEVVW